MYYYGQPTLTADSGFIKMDPSNMEWEVAAQYDFCRVNLTITEDSQPNGKTQKKRL